LPDGHRQAIEAATVIFGSERQLALLSGLDARLLNYPIPFQGLSEQLQAHQAEHIVLLASGDPLLFGIGGWLSRQLPATALRFHANISSIQAAFAQLGLPWQQAQVISLHGRPLASLKPQLRGSRLYALLTDHDNHPAAIAASLCELEQSDADCWVAEALGSADEAITHYSAADLMRSDRSFKPLNVVVLKTSRGDLIEFPGIPDTDFITDGDAGAGMISKREVRLMTLSLLQPAAEEIGWDIGAGCGGIAIEWARWNQLGSVIAIENHSDRLSCLNANREKFGVSGNLQVIAASAPGCLVDLPDPDCIFVGGGGRDLGAILDKAWSRLKPGGRLVATAVTEPSRIALQRFADSTDKNPEWTQIAISRPQTLGGQLVLQPRLPVLLMKCTKRTPP